MAFWKTKHLGNYLGNKPFNTIMNVTQKYKKHICDTFLRKSDTIAVRIVLRTFL